MELGCFVNEEEVVVEEKEEQPQQTERKVSDDLYQQIKERITYREISHKEPHIVGAAFSNLDNNFHIDKNTRLEEGSIPSFASVQGCVAMGIYSKHFIGKIVEDIKALNVSIGGKGREEKVRMVSDNKNMSRGLKSFSDALKSRQSVEEQVVEK